MDDGPLWLLLLLLFPSTPFQRISFGAQNDENPVRCQRQLKQANLPVTWFGGRWRPLNEASKVVIFC